MNKPQKVVVLVAVLFVAAMLLFPPWQRIWGAGGVFSMPLSYAPLFSPPTDQANVDVTRLAVQVGVVTVLAFGACVALSRKSGD